MHKQQIPSPWLLDLYEVNVDLVSLLSKFQLKGQEGAVCSKLISWPFPFHVSNPFLVSLPSLRAFSVWCPDLIPSPRAKNQEENIHKILDYMPGSSHFGWSHHRISGTSFNILSYWFLCSLLTLGRNFSLKVFLDCLPNKMNSQCLNECQKVKGVFS